jgi:hypothetical protein
MAADDLYPIPRNYEDLPDDWFEWFRRIEDLFTNKGSMVKHVPGNFAYTCLVEHTSAVSNKPGTGADWQTYWKQAGNLGDAVVWAAGVSYRTGGIDWDLINKETFSVGDLVAFIIAGTGINVSIQNGGDRGQYLQIKIDTQGNIIDASLSVTQTAGASYTANERAMLTALKNQGIEHKLRINQILAALRSAGLIT